MPQLLSKIPPLLLVENWMVPNSVWVLEIIKLFTLNHFLIAWTHESVYEQVIIQSNISVNYICIFLKLTGFSSFPWNSSEISVAVDSHFPFSLQLKKTTGCYQSVNFSGKQEIGYIQKSRSPIELTLFSFT